MSVENIFRRFPVRTGHPVFLPGAVGSQLALKGVPEDAFAALSHPDFLRSVHVDYIEAGADFTLTDTFRVSAHRLDDNPDLAVKTIKQAYFLPRQVPNDFLQDRALIGSIAPLNDCYVPKATPDEETLIREHLKTVAMHQAHNPDFLCFETLPTLREAIAMRHAAVQFSLAFILSFTVNDEGNLLDGTSIQEAEEATRSLWRVGIGVNCCSIEGAENAVRQLKKVVPPEQHIIAYPNGYKHTREQFGDCATHHGAELEAQKETFTPKEFLVPIRRLVASGATMVGGCCGTGPEHTEAYVKAFRR